MLEVIRNREQLHRNVLSKMCVNAFQYSVYHLRINKCKWDKCYAASTIFY
jgi:hypothetical protein